MNNDEQVTYYPPLGSQAPNGRRGLKIFGILLLVLLFAGAIGFSAFSWMKQREAQQQLSNERSKNQALSEEVSRLKKAAPETPETETITSTLPNGKSITYPDTEENRNILWWTHDASDPKGATIAISHKAYREFTARQSPDLIVQVCGTSTNLKALQGDLQYGAVDTTDKKIILPQNPNCVDMFASKENKNDTSRKDAVEVLATIKKDIEAFLASATIEDAIEQ